MGLAERLGNATLKNTDQEKLGGLFGEPEQAKTTFGAKVVLLGVEFTDPRPDLDQIYKDGMLWAQLLALAHGKDKMLCGNLHGFRCQGTKLVKGEKNGYLIRPIIGANGWASAQRYEQDRERYLRPHLAAVVELLGELFEWEARQ